MLFRRVEHTVFRTPPLSFPIVHVQVSIPLHFKKESALFLYIRYAVSVVTVCYAMQVILFKERKLMEPRQTHIFTDTFINVCFKAWKGPGNRIRGNYLGAPYNQI